jgi:hypothetical protein
LSDGPPEERRDPMLCSCCRVRLQYVGRRRFHEGARWGFLGNLGELFVNRERFGIYVCPRCGRVEFFIDGVGESLRPC